MSAITSVAATLRRISADDNAAIARVIRKVSAEYGLTADKGYTVADPNLDELYELYSQPGSAYWVVEKEGEVVGGGGVAPLACSEPDICELQKMYFMTSARGQGLAKKLALLALDYARVERCAPGEAAPRVRALIQQQRDALEEMSTLMKEIDASHIRYRKRAVQRAQFLLLSDRSSQGSVTALLRRYAEEIRTPDQLFEPDDGPVAVHLHLYPAAAFGEKFLYPPAAPRTAAPLAPVQAETLDPDQLRKEQQLLLDYARLAVTEENVALLAQQALAARPQVEASTLAEEYPGDFARIIGLHTYSQSPHRNYDIRLTGNWVERGGFRFEDFVLTRRKEENDGND